MNLLQETIMEMETNNLLPADIVFIGSADWKTALSFTGSSTTEASGGMFGFRSRWAVTQLSQSTRGGLSL